MTNCLCCAGRPSFTRRTWFTLALVGGAWIAGLLSAANSVAQQITTQTLIGDAVAEVGTQYADVDQAIQRFTNRDFLGARQFLESAKRKDPKLPPTDLTLAKLYILTNNAAAGRAALEKTAMENPGDPEAYLILADQAIQQGRMIEADALYEKGLQLTDKFNDNAKRKRNFEMRGRSGRALVFERRANWPAATADLQAFLKADPQNGTGHYRLGRALFMQKKYQEGYNEFKTAKAIDKNLHDPAIAAALQYDQLGMTNEAQQAFDKGLAANKNDPVSLTAYGRWLIKTGAVQKAEQVLADARKSNPESVDLLVLSGVAARMAKRMKPAEDYFMEALRISPANSDVINQLALLLIDQPEQAKQDRALQFALISSQLNAQSGDAQVTLAWVLYQLKRLGEAEQALRQAAQFGNLSPDSNYLFAKILAEQNRGEMAKQILQSAMENPNQAIFINQKEAQSLLETLK